MWLRGQDSGWGTRPRLGYLKLVASGQDPNWNTSSFAASWSRSRLGYLKFVACGFVVRIPVGILQVCGFAVKIPVGIPQVLWLRPGWIPQVCGFAVKIPVGTHEVLWLRSNDPGRDTSSLVVALSRSRLGYVKFCGFVPVDTSSWWPRSQDPGWDKSRFVASQSKSRWGSSTFLASWSGSRLGYLKFCGFVVKIPGGIPQVLWLRGQDPGWDTSSLWLHAHAGPRLGHLKFCGIAVKIPVGIPQVCGFAVEISVQIPQVLWLRG